MGIDMRIRNTAILASAIIGAFMAQPSFALITVMPGTKAYAFYDIIPILQADIYEVYYSQTTGPNGTGAQTGPKYDVTFYYGAGAPAECIGYINDYPFIYISQ
jgi:hypothetical protein